MSETKIWKRIESFNRNDNYKITKLKMNSEEKKKRKTHSVHDFGFMKNNEN